MTHRSAEAAAGAHPSSTPVGRSAAFERTLTTVFGLLLVAAGLAALVVGTGWVGTFRGRRPVLDPLIEQWWRSNPWWGAGLALAAGIVLLVLGLWWVARAGKREPKPDMRLEESTSGSTTVTSSAITDAVRSDAEAVTGVTRARVRMAGTSRSPALRLTLSLQEGTNVRQVWDELDGKVLSHAREALETEVVPTTIRLRLDRAARQRVR